MCSACLVTRGVLCVLVAFRCNVYALYAGGRNVLTENDTFGAYYNYSGHGSSRIDNVNRASMAV